MYEIAKTAESYIAAVVSLYNPGMDVVARCAALLEQVDYVIAVDDGSPDQDCPVFAQLEEAGIYVLRLPVNSGIAYALNTGIRAAYERDHKTRFILTMDQDSCLGSGYTTKLLAAYEVANSDGVEVGMVAPGTIGGLPTRRRGKLKSSILGGEPIQSGLLIPRDALDAVGLMMEELFIDGVDTEFYLRSRGAGKECVLAPDAHLEHALGTMETGTLFGKKVSLAGHPLRIRTAASFRYYYIFRNRLLLVRKYWRSQPAWAIKGIFSDYRHLLIVSIFAPGRIARISSAIAGIGDGLKAITGPRGNS